MLTLNCVASPEVGRQKACALLWLGTSDLVSTSRPTWLGTEQAWLKKRKGRRVLYLNLGKREEGFALTTSECSKAWSILRNDKVVRDQWLPISVS